MSLKLSSSSRHVPFFPPGIAQHKTVSHLSNERDITIKRPQTVKECKTLFKDKNNRMTSSLRSSQENQNNLRRFSISTPNLKVCHLSDKTNSIHKHNCDMGIPDHEEFKATPLPTYYMSGSCERNFPFSINDNDKLKSRSLDRFSSLSKSRNLTGFIPDKPFYPPSKYPNIHDKVDNNIQRLIETRQKYRTPESRKTTHEFARRKSLGNSEREKKKIDQTQNKKKDLKDSKKFGSTPNLRKKNENSSIKSNIKESPNSKIIKKVNLNAEVKTLPKKSESTPEKKNIKGNQNPNSKTSNAKKDSPQRFYEDEFAYSSEIGPYRRSDKLDLETSDDIYMNPSNEMYTSYFYPKPIPNQRKTNENDRMAQSLVLERSLASMVYTGSLDRAIRNVPSQNYNEITDVDESPTKSISAPKRINSFSQDSLDGNKTKKKQPSQLNNVLFPNSNIYENNNKDELSLNSERSSTMSQIEEDEFKNLSSYYVGLPDRSPSNFVVNHYWDSLPIKMEQDQYNIDQLTKPSLITKDLSSFTYSGKTSPISAHNEFISNREHSIIGKDDQTLLNDLASKCIVSTDQKTFLLMVSDDSFPVVSPIHSSHGGFNSTRGIDDNILLNKIAKTCILSTESNCGQNDENDDHDLINNMISTQKSNSENNSGSLLEKKNTDPQNLTPPHCDNIIITHDNLTGIKICNNPKDDDHVLTGLQGSRIIPINNGKDNKILSSNERLAKNDEMRLKIRNNPKEDDYSIESVGILGSRINHFNNEGENKILSSNKHLAKSDEMRPKTDDGSYKQKDYNIQLYDTGSNRIIGTDHKKDKIIITNDNLTGIKLYDYENEGKYEEREGGTYNKYSKILLTDPNRTEGNLIQVLHDSGYSDKKYNNNKERSYQDTFMIPDEDSKKMLITNENHTGNKILHTQNVGKISAKNEDHRSTDDRPSHLNIGTDQYNNQILITKDNFTKIQRVTTPLDGGLSTRNYGYIELNDGSEKYFMTNAVKEKLGEIYEGKDRCENEYFNNPDIVQKELVKPSFLSALNIQSSDSNYKQDEMWTQGNNNILASGIPNIEIEGDGDVSETSSTNEFSWSGYDENNSCRDYMESSIAMQRSGIPWVSSPELHSANNIYYGKSGRHLQSENPLKPLCNYCHKPAYFMERISISNIIFHKTCFKCRKCHTHLNFNNCIIHHNRAYCEVHMRPKIRKGLRSVSTNKLNQIKERLDNKSGQLKNLTAEEKQQKRIFYAGMNSAKTKFLDDATKIKETPLRDPKRITPPRQGFNSGVIESEPKPRDPNIVACSDNQNSYLDEVSRLSQSNSTKETRARFKELQERSLDSKETLNSDGEESILNRRPDVIPVDTKSLRNRFLVTANDSETKFKKINPSDEIRRMSEKEVNSIYENEPESRADIIKSDSEKEDVTVSPISRTRAKEMKERFTNFAQNEKPKKSEVKLEYGEGGVYESNPQEKNDDVIKYNYDTTFYLPENTVKSGLQRIKDLQDIKSQGFQKVNKEPIKLETDPSQSGIYENTPEQSRADSISCQNDGVLMDFREKNYANEAKRALLEKQKLGEDTSSKRSTPHMIDIWKDLCPDSGIFENVPKEQRKDVVKHDTTKYELAVQPKCKRVNSNDNTTDTLGENNIQETF